MHPVNGLATGTGTAGSIGFRFRWRTEDFCAEAVRVHSHFKQHFGPASAAEVEHFHHNFTFHFRIGVELHELIADTVLSHPAGHRAVDQTMPGHFLLHDRYVGPEPFGGDYIVRAVSAIVSFVFGHSRFTIEDDAADCPEPD